MLADTPLRRSGRVAVAAFGEACAAATVEVAATSAIVSEHRSRLNVVDPHHAIDAELTLDASGFGGDALVPSPPADSS